MEKGWRGNQMSVITAILSFVNVYRVFGMDGLTTVSVLVALVIGLMFIRSKMKKKKKATQGA